MVFNTIILRVDNPYPSKEDPFAIKNRIIVSLDTHINILANSPNSSTIKEGIKNKVIDSIHEVDLLQEIKTHILKVNAITQDAFKSMQAAEKLLTLIQEYENTLYNNITIRDIRGLEILERYNRRNQW